MTLSSMTVLISKSLRTSDRTLASDVSLEAKTNSEIGLKLMFVVIFGLRGKGVI
jgi:hypothetical protein